MSLIMRYASALPVIGLLLSNGPTARAQEDCAMAAVYAPFATVTCYYDWYNSNGRNFLNYVVGISGTSQRQQGWCDGIVDNVLGKCGQGRALQMSCIQDDVNTLEWGFDEGTGQEIPLYGINLNFHSHIWAPGEDNKVCVAEAIRAATCDTVSLDEFECFIR